MKRAKKNIKLEWYVVNSTRNGNTEVEFYNIFNNFHVYEDSIKLTKQYEKGDFKWDEYVDKLDHLLMYEEWGRCEYEFLATRWPLPNEPQYKKLDCYTQAHQNIKVLAKYVYNAVYGD